MDTRVEIDTILFSSPQRFPYELPAGDKIVAGSGRRVEWVPAWNVYEVTVEGRGSFLLHRNDHIAWATLAQRPKKGGR